MFWLSDAHLSDENSEEAAVTLVWGLQNEQGVGFLRTLGVAQRAERGWTKPRWNQTYTYRIYTLKLNFNSTYLHKVTKCLTKYIGMKQHRTKQDKTKNDYRKGIIRFSYNNMF